MARITLDGIAHAYGGKPRSEQDYALKPLHHVWEQGMAYALLGPSGCGKTTLLNIISGLVIASEGRLLFDDIDVTRLPTKERNIAQVFQFPVIYDTMTVAENLAFPLKNRRLPRAPIERRVTEIAAMLDLTSVLNRRARGLTADAKQKISLGRGLVRSDVSAVLFDEPLTVIDPALKWELRSKLKAVHRALDLLMIYLTHDQIEALTFADKVVVMNDGKAVQIGTPDDLFERPEHTFVGYFIGSPGMNLMAAKVLGSRALVDGVELQLSAVYPDPPKGQRVQIGVRPDYTELSSMAGVPVQVRRVADLGRKRLVYVNLGGQQIVATIPPECLQSAIRQKLCSIRSTPTFTWTTFASRERPHDGQADQQSRVAFRSARPGLCAVLIDHPRHDGRELFGSGHDGREQFLLERRPLVSRSPEPERRDWRAIQRRPISHPRLLARLPPDRGAARHCDRSVHTAERMAGRAHAGGDGAADAHSVERGGYDLADVYPRGHPAFRSDAHRTRPPLQRDARPDFRLDHDRCHRHVALDAARHSAELCGSQGDPRRLLSGGPNRWREPLGDFLQHRIAEAAKGPRHRGAVALHADVYDLHRAVRRDGRRRPGQRNHLPLDRSGQDRLGPGRPRQRRRDVPRLLSDHAYRLLGLLHDHDPARAKEGRLMRQGVLPKFSSRPIWWC